MNNIFCRAPFMHLYVGYAGRPRLCCASILTEKVKTLSTIDSSNFWDYWQGEYLTEVRNDMLNNVPRKECEPCYTIEDTGGKSFRNAFDIRHSHIDLQGKELFLPNDLDIRFSKLCNLKCRMCSESISSQLEKEMTNNYSLLKQYRDQITQPIMSENNFKKILDNINSIDYIKVAGGEPSIMPEVESFLQAFIDNNRHTGDNAVNLLITTNCTNQNTKFEKLINQFSNVTLTVSFEGIGLVNNYIRSPSNFDILEQILISYLKKHKCILNATIQAYNLPYLIEFVNWLKYINENFGQLDAFFMLLDQPGDLACYNLSKSLRNYYVDMYLENIDFDATWLADSNLKSSLELLKKDQSEISNYRFVHRTKAFDHVRNQHIKDYLPEVFEDIQETYTTMAMPS